MNREMETYNLGGWQVPTQSRATRGWASGVPNFGSGCPLAKNTSQDGAP